MGDELGPTPNTRERGAERWSVYAEAVRKRCLWLKDRPVHACVCLDSGGLQPVIAPLSRVGRRNLSDP